MAPSDDSDMGSQHAEEMLETMPEVLRSAVVHVPVFYNTRRYDWDEEHTDLRDRSWLPNDDLVGDRVPLDSVTRHVELAMQGSPYLNFFLEPHLGQYVIFSYIPIWHWATTTRPLDEIILLGNSRVRFNGKGEHGWWEHSALGSEDGQFLDVNVNVKYGEPDFPDEPDMGKWLRFQRIPGTESWICCERADDHTWSIMLTPLQDARNFQTHT